MADRYTQLYYHFIWATKNRQPFLTPEVEAPLFRYLRQKCETLFVFVYALNGMTDHVHLACTLPTTLAVADFLEVLKGASAHFVNHCPDLDSNLIWQPGYGALTFARRDLACVVEYIDHQKAHHRQGRLSAEMERLSD
jgi:putative transposase